MSRAVAGRRASAATCGRRAGRPVPGGRGRWRHSKRGPAPGQRTMVFCGTSVALVSPALLASCFDSERKGAMRGDRAPLDRPGSPGVTSRAAAERPRVRPAPGRRHPHHLQVGEAAGRNGAATGHPGHPGHRPRPLGRRRAPALRDVPVRGRPARPGRRQTHHRQWSRSLGVRNMDRRPRPDRRRPLPPEILLRRQPAEQVADTLQTDRAGRQGPVLVRPVHRPDGGPQADQGAVLGPLSAHHSYAGARSVFTQLDIPRRIAQLDLSLAVVAEMSGKLERAARPTRPWPSTTGSPAATGPAPGCGWAPR